MLRERGTYYANWVRDLTIVHCAFANACEQYTEHSVRAGIVKRRPYAKDPMKELVDACHKYDMKFGFYYSLGRD